MAKKVAVIKGDGVGPELTDLMMKTVKAAGSKAGFVECEAGAGWWEKHGGNSLIPEETWKALSNTDACFKGPTTTPGGAGSPKSVAVSIRQKFDLYANVRPIKSYKGTAAPLGEVDFVCVREGTEGLYVGEEVQLTDDVYIAIRKITRPSCRRIAKYAFEEAKRRKWKSVVAIHKSNILKKTDGAFLEECEAVKKQYKGIELEEYHVDNVAQQLIKNPANYNQKVLLSTNLFMDILSEECSSLVGSIGLIYSANIGDKYAMFEPAHGSAPKYAGMDKVNPVATVLAGAWMIDYLGEKKQSQAIFKATEKVIAEKKHVTYDMGGKAKSSQMVDAIIKHL
ncbi:isocitrate/isopropylmalate dehydrogenase family protein [Methanocella paludicola SANAE]|uniref:Isocitrate/isopropylmalate dehydrogenase family protein n=1 Tax=Methanocella paludicola (strain DSM 17711 / JCM 13418 / NBRC 101707 / SANAE) TaxID=304371 RepID=D1YVN7_METPS|nr:isocitrate/isopropylmalate dehydrogenase family protein [Methanocella paludicola]BAI60509.1 isocitrate/isopropylmalate dehydrogenase family protein [Methanocella paludicola SANAE]